jgi:hypothetical protein
MENEYIIDFTSQIIAAKDKEDKEETGCGCGKGCGCESESDESEAAQKSSDFLDPKRRSFPVNWM